MKYENKFSIPLWIALIVVLISKNIIIIHDETLVLVCFILFIYAATSYGSAAVNEELTERSNKISQEFVSYFSARKKTLNSLISYYKSSSTLVKEMSELFDELKTQIALINVKKRDLLENNIAHYINAKLKSIVLKESEILQKMQLKISSNFYDLISTKFKNQLSANFDNLINQSVEQLTKLDTDIVNYNGNKKPTIILLQNLYK